MRIAFFVGRFPEISETFILYQITGLIDLGHEVDIYSEYHPNENTVIHEDVIRYKLIERTTYLSDHIPAASGTWEMPVWPVDGETWLPGDEIPLLNKDRIAKAIPVLEHCLAKHPVETFKLLDTDLYGVEARSLSALYRLYFLSDKGGRYDIIHCHFGPVGNKFRFLKELWKIPIVVTFHGYDFSYFPLTHGKDYYRNLFPLVDAVTANSIYAKDRIEELGCDPERIHHLNVGIKLKEFPFRNREIIQNGSINILTVGRMVEKKGIAYSIQAIAKIKSNYPSIIYDIIGNGPLLNELQDLTKELNLEDAIKFHGSRSADFVIKKMNEAHIFLLTSIKAESGDQEGTPVVLMEAQAMGLPVVSTLHSGIPEIVLNNKSGFLVEEKNIDETSKRIAQLIMNPALLIEMGNNGRAFMEKNHDLKKLNQELESLYQQLIKENEKRSDAS